MILLKILLLPFSALYLLLTKFRNHLFNIEYKRSFKFDTNVINVGNLRVGGTGKSPHVEYVIRLLKEKYKVAVLSRGYGRKTKGIIIADESSSAKTIGDEPMQFYKKFSKEISVTVGEERALAIPTILFEKEGTDVIILDDAYQHRTVVPDLNILLSDYNHPFYKDMVLPSGRLRESRSGAKRADIIIVTKCPDDLSNDEMKKIERRIKKYSDANVNVFFTGIRYQNPIPVFEDKFKFEGKVLLVSGIANPSLIIKEVKSKYALGNVLNFGDHYSYSDASVQKILKHFHDIQDNPKMILTTEKDMVKLGSENFREYFKDIPFFYLPIEIYFLNNKDLFDSLVFGSIKQKNLVL